MISTGPTTSEDRCPVSPRTRRWLVVLAWIFFRAESVADAGVILTGIASFTVTDLGPYGGISALMVRISGIASRNPTIPTLKRTP